LGLPAFGTLGVQSVQFGGATDTSRANTVAVLSKGALLLAGYTKPAAGKKNSALAQLSGTDGSLDINFFAVGKRSFDLCGFGQDDEIRDLALQSTDQKVIAVGYCAHNAAAPLNKDMFVARFNTDGTLDTTFNSAGSVPGVLTVDIASKDDEAFGAVIQSDGKIIAGGYGTTAGAQEEFVVIRVKTDGTLDSTFGTSGIVQTIFGTGNARAQTLTLDPDGRILLGGYSTSTTRDYAYARYIP
jgi:uncharacterized delta-60 repeat protein